MNHVISLFSGLLLTIVILYLSYVFTKNFGKGFGLKWSGTYMQILDRLPLGQDKAVAVVRLGSRCYLIGIASSQITLLSEFPAENIPEEISSGTSFTGTEGYESFKKLLKKYTDRHRDDR